MLLLDKDTRLAVGAKLSSKRARTNLEMQPSFFCFQLVPSMSTSVVDRDSVAAPKLCQYCLLPIADTIDITFIFICGKELFSYSQSV